MKIQIVDGNGAEFKSTLVKFLPEFAIAEVKDGEIVSITLGQHGETEGIFEGAVDGVIPEIIKGQTTEVDTVSGATITCNGLQTMLETKLAPYYNYLKSQVATEPATEKVAEGAEANVEQ